MKKDGITCVFNFGDDSWGNDAVPEGEEVDGGGLFSGMGMFADDE